MKKFLNGIEMKAGHVELKLKGGLATYTIFGFSHITMVENKECVVLQPADLRQSATMIVPKELVSSIVVNF